MISKTETLKIIKEKVDSRSTRKIKLKKQISCKFIEGTFRHEVRKKIVSLYKQGNSVMWVDNNYGVRNINMLDTVSLHKIMWQLISEKEKREIALEHLLTTKTYLED